MMTDLMSSMVDGLLVFLGVAAGLMASIGTILSDTNAMSTPRRLKTTLRSSRQSLPKAA